MKENSSLKEGDFDYLNILIDLERMMEEIYLKKGGEKMPVLLE